MQTSAILSGKRNDMSLAENSAMASFVLDSLEGVAPGGAGWVGLSNRVGVKLAQVCEILCQTLCLGTNSDGCCSQQHELCTRQLLDTAPHNAMWRRLNVPLFLEEIKICALRVCP